MSDAAAVPESAPSCDGRPTTTLDMLGELAQLLRRFGSDPPPPDDEGDTDPGVAHGIGSDTDR